MSQHISDDDSGTRPQIRAQVAETKACEISLSRDWLLQISAKRNHSGSFISQARRVSSCSISYCMTLKYWVRRWRRKCEAWHPHWKRAEHCGCAGAE